MCDDTQNEGLQVYAFLDDLLDKLIIAKLLLEKESQDLIVLILVQ